MEGIRKLIEQAKELDKRATPGPWKWDMRKSCRDAKIVTDHSGQYYVMCFERWGMQGAAPSFQVYDRYEGPVSERGSHGMRRADALAKSYPGKEHHVGFDDYPDHPDAKFIVESRKLVPELIAAIEQLTAELERSAARLAAYEDTGLAPEDVVPVVRCGNCCFTQQSPYALCVWCNKHHKTMKATDFCSYGERKDND